MTGEIYITVQTINNVTISYTYSSLYGKGHGALADSAVWLFPSLAAIPIVNLVNFIRNFSSFVTDLFQPSWRQQAALESFKPWLSCQISE